MRMARWMCGVKRNDRISNKVVLERQAIKSGKEVIRVKRLGWFGHVERKDETERVKKVV